MLSSVNSFRSQSIVVPFGRKSSWKTKQILRHEAKATKELEKEMKEAAQKEREACNENNGSDWLSLHCSY